MDLASRSAGEDVNPYPLVELFTPNANATWLLAELDPGEPDRAFGLSDLGLGLPELGYVALSELRAIRGPLGLAVERDQHFIADRQLSAYADVAHDRRRIET
ncbi:DUF2958 domain-containing protein [Lichenibacterium minor]|uniref:DUF2958 domain-containing protein n=1 Tax=Lichenibacterium minor TaxID=2316528 RepID=UPI003D182DE5